MRRRHRHLGDTRVYWGEAVGEMGADVSDDDNKIVGHFTLRDGSHLPLTAKEAREISDEDDRKHAERAERLPDVHAAINAMFDAYDRLRELGWREACYCPKDGTEFEVIEAGSTGIFPCVYEGEWPTGCYWIQEDGGCPSRPILFRLYPEDEAKRQAKLAEAAARCRAEREAAP